MSVSLIALALIILAYLSECSGRATYQAMMEHYLGRMGLYICNVFICLHNFGACVTFLVILADQLDQCEYLCLSSFLNLVLCLIRMYQ